MPTTVYLVDMVLYPIFEKVAEGKETEASTDAQAKIDTTVSATLQLKWKSMVFTVPDSDALAKQLNEVAKVDLSSIIAGSIGGTAGAAVISGVSVVQPGEWTPTGGGHHASYMPVVADVGPSGSAIPTEWSMQVTTGGSKVDFIVFASVRWKKLTTLP